METAYTYGLRVRNDKKQSKELKKLKQVKCLFHGPTPKVSNDGEGGWVLVEGSGIMIDDPDNSFQQKLMEKMLKHMLKKGGKTIYEEGPFIEYEEDGEAGMTKKVFIRNPYYRGKDPMTEIIWKVKNGDGTWGFVRNPFAPGGAPLWSNTYEMFEYKGFFQPEVDPYFN